MIIAGRRELFEMLEMLYMFAKTHNLKKMNFTVCKLYLNKPDLEYTRITSLLGHMWM